MQYLKRRHHRNPTDKSIICDISLSNPSIKRHRITLDEEESLSALSRSLLRRMLGAIDGALPVLTRRGMYNTNSKMNNERSIATV